MRGTYDLSWLLLGVVVTGIAVAFYWISGRERAGAFVAEI